VELLQALQPLYSNTFIEFHKTTKKFLHTQKILHLGYNYHYNDKKIFKQGIGIAEKTKKQEEITGVVM